MNFLVCFPIPFRLPTKNQQKRPKILLKNPQLVRNLPHASKSPTCPFNSKSIQHELNRKSLNFHSYLILYSRSSNTSFMIIMIWKRINFIEKEVKLCKIFIYSCFLREDFPFHNNMTDKNESLLYYDYCLRYIKNETRKCDVWKIYDMKTNFSIIFSLCVWFISWRNFDRFLENIFWK